MEGVWSESAASGVHKPKIYVHNIMNMNLIGKTAIIIGLINVTGAFEKLS